MKLRLAFCFLDEDNNIFAEEDLNASWNMDKDKDMERLESVIIFDEVAAVLNNQVEPNLYAHIRNLLDKVKGIKDA